MVNNDEVAECDAISEDYIVNISGIFVGKILISFWMGKYFFVGFWESLGVI